MKEQFLWTEKYRPKKVSETILPSALKKTFQGFVDHGEVPNLLLTGSPGTGKTTIARAMLEELGCDYVLINASLNRNIDTLRNDITNFASSVSLTGKRKYVILDEADFLNPQSFQPALRHAMEHFASNCGFILTANYKKQIIEPIHSRCSVIDFIIDKNERPVLAMQFMKRAISILDENNIEYDKKVLVEIIQKYFPDWRRVLNELQRYSVSGKIDTGILNNIVSISINELIGFMKQKDFTSVRKWIGENLDGDSQHFFREFYDKGNEYFQKKYIPELVLLIARYQYQAAFAQDQEINLAAFCVECMLGAEWC